MPDNTMKCDICFNEFNEDIVIPKVLTCGHSFCLPCLTNLIISSPLCPNCRRKLDKDKPAIEYPTNYSILDAVKLLEHSNSMTSTQIKRRIEDNIDCLKKKKRKISSDFDQTCVDLSKLQNLIDPQNKIIDLDQATQILDSLEIKFKGTRDDPLAYFKNLRRSVNIDIDNFESCNKYLTEIYTKLLKKEKIYAVKVVNLEVVKYGEVSVEDNMLLFHSLSETEKPEDSSFIWFDDLKRCVVENRIFTFLKLCCNEDEVVRLVRIEMFDDYKGVSTFIKLCTGEYGISYKGNKYIKNNGNRNSIGILSCFNANTSESIVDAPMDYISKMRNKKPGNEGENYVSIYNKSLYIYKLKCNKTYINTVGKVESPTNLDELISFKDESKLKIIDCGIIFKL